MRIGILGAGSLGSLFAGLLADASGEPSAEPALLTRESAHTEAIRRDGLRLVRPDGSAVDVVPRVVTAPADAPSLDAVLVCVKSYDTADALDAWRPALGDADVCTLQNGLGNAEAIAAAVPRERVLAGTTNHGADRPEPGVVRHAGTGETRLGRYFATTDERAVRLAAALSAPGAPTEAVADAVAVVWEKVLVNVGINAPTALARVPNGRVADTDAGRRLARCAITEAARVARAEGADVGDDAVAETLDVARATASNRSSMRQDIEAGRPTEVESLYGAVVERAREHDLSAPANATLADLVRLAQTAGSSGRGQP